MTGKHTVSVLADAAGIARAIRVPAFTLKLRTGDRHEQRFAQARTLIGLSASADFCIRDPTVSAVHCEILLDETGARVRDLGAKNGVILDGRRVQEAWLKPKDQVCLGESDVSFKLLDEVEDQPLGKRASLGGLRGSSARMRQLYDQLVRAAANDVSVLLVGATGTGKELAADALVSESRRRDRPLVVVDCAALPGMLAESELFGHERGAFTGAAEARPGAFERAQGGTLFLDEVGELPLPLQSKLLGVLERKAVQRLGGKAPFPVDVRVIAATHRDLPREVNAGTFRADLFYRLAGVEIRLPSLNEHREDIPELISHFVDEVPKGAKVSPAVLKQLYEADYPGNVRQLRQMVERAALGLDFEPAPITRTRAIDLRIPYRFQKERMLVEFERDYVTDLLEAAGGNVSKAARLSGMSRVHLHEILRRLKG